MHLKRQALSKLIPLPRKGKKFVVRPASYTNSAIPVLVVLRDILKLASTKKEVKKMINKKLLKINWKPVKDFKESIKLFNILEADKTYCLKISDKKRFFLEEIKDSKKRLCKVLNKTKLPKNLIQLNLHDGSNIVTKEKVLVGDSIYIDDSFKIKEIKHLEKSSQVFISKGKYQGFSGKVLNIERNKVTIKLTDKEVTLPKANLFVI